MKSYSLLVTLAVGGLLCGCARVNLSEGFLAEDELRLLDMGWDASSKESGGYMPPFPELRSSLNVPELDAESSGASPLPAFVRDEPATRKLLAAMDAAANGTLIRPSGTNESATARGEARREVSLELTSSDLKSMTEMISREFLASSGKSNSSGLGDNEFVTRLRTYLFAYFTAKDGFVSRTGAKLKPAGFEGDVSNDHILPVVAIFIEALTDQVLQFDYVNDRGSYRAPFPVMTTGGKYVVGHQPTVSLFQSKKQEEPIDRELAEGPDSVSEMEYKGVRYISGLAAENSEFLSGMLFRLIGDVQVAFVIGPHFSFGDNETLAKMVDTIIKGTVHQTVEAAAIKFALSVEADIRNETIGRSVLDFKSLDLED